MSKQTRPSFATATVAEITAGSPQTINPDQALWPNAGTIRANTHSTPINKDDKDVNTEKINKIEKIVFSNKLEAATYLKLQQLATYGGENIQEILEAALNAYFVGKEEASRPLPPKVLTGLRKKHPYL